MDIQTIVDLAINQVGEEQGRMLLGTIKDLIGKCNNSVFIITKVGGKVSLISSTKSSCDINFKEKPKIYNIEDTINSIEI